MVFVTLRYLGSSTDKPFFLFLIKVTKIVLKYIMCLYSINTFQQFFPYLCNTKRLLFLEQLLSSFDLRTQTLAEDGRYILVRKLLNKPELTSIILRYDDSTKFQFLEAVREIVGSRANVVLVNRQTQARNIRLSQVTEHGCGDIYLTSRMSQAARLSELLFHHGRQTYDQCP